MGVLNKNELIAGGLDAANSILGYTMPAKALPPLRAIGARLISDDAAGLADFEGYLGQQTAFITAFAETNNAAGTWLDSLAAMRAQITALKPLNRPIYWAFPLCHLTIGHRAAETLRGDHDATIKTMFEELLACDRPLLGRKGERFFLIRLGWEMQLWSAYPWCRLYITASEYKQLYRRIVTIARSVSSEFVFDFTPNIRTIGEDQKVVDYKQFWPGRDLVSMMGADIYARAAIEAANGNSPAQTIYNIWDAEGGLMDMYRFAESHGIPFGIPETGFQGDGTANNSSTGDAYAPLWKRYYEFVRTKNVALLGLWNKATPFNCRLSGASPQYPVQAAYFKAAFEQVAKPWTPQLQFGTELVSYRKASQTADFVTDGTLVTSWADSAGKLASNTGSARPNLVANARNGYQGVVFDGADDTLTQADVSNVAAMGKAHTIFVQAYTDPNAVNFSYYLSDTTAAGGGGSANESRAFGHNADNLRIQGGATPLTGPAVKSIDASIIVTYRDAYAAGSNRSTVMYSVNDSGLSSDGGVVTLPSVAITKRVIGGQGATGDGVSNRITGILFEIGEISRTILPSEASAVHAGSLWDVGAQANLPATSPYKAARPTYGGPMPGY